MSSSARIFTCFPDLPLELQIEVWKYVVQATPPLTVDQIASWRPWGVPVTATITGRKPLTRFPYHILELPQEWAYGQTCRLARLLLLQWWKKTLQKCKQEDHPNSIELKLRVVRILDELIGEVRGRLKS